MQVVIALDAGTTGVRAIAVAHDGSFVADAYREFTQHFPRPGWVEHDADEIWTAMRTVVDEVARRLDTDGHHVAALGITDQRETVVAWDRRDGRPLHRAIVWQDRRSAARCEALAEAGHLDLVRSTTGLVLDPYFSGTKLEWLFTEGGVDPASHVAVGTVDSWLLWQLTGGEVHATDTSNASRTMLFDIGALRWSDELCDLLGVPAHVLPEVRPSSGRLGVTAAGTTALGAGVPISGIAGDQQSALFGQACFEAGMTKNTYGTGSFVLMNVGDRCPPPVDGLLTTVAWTLGDPGAEPSVAAGRTAYAYEGAIFVTGAAIQWLRDGLGIIDAAPEIGPLAEQCADTEGVVFVPALTGLGSPWWDPWARGTVLGITRGTGRAHLARAAVEAMAFQTRDVVEAMAAASGQSVLELRVDGGASVMDLLLSVQADQLGVPVTRPTCQETTALGAAYLAGLAEGVWDGPHDVTANWAVDRRVEPGGDEVRAAADAAYARWLRAVDRARTWAVD